MDSRSARPVTVCMCFSFTTLCSWYSMPTSSSLSVPVNRCFLVHLRCVSDLLRRFCFMLNDSHRMRWLVSMMMRFAVTTTTSVIVSSSLTDLGTRYSSAPRHLASFSPRSFIAWYVCSAIRPGCSVPGARTRDVILPSMPAAPRHSRPMPSPNLEPPSRTPVMGRSSRPSSPLPVPSSRPAGPYSRAPATGSRYRPMTALKHPLRGSATLR
mmetsp:Transcript_2914/g.7258  ORF Transcript_2914/g.7258 Transcript_2914/m.7258 type:complete len:211 (-) Transcript_2914:591-1223(-)